MYAPSLSSRLYAYNQHCAVLEYLHQAREQVPATLRHEIHDELSAKDLFCQELSLNAKFFILCNKLLKCSLSKKLTVDEQQKQQKYENKIRREKFETVETLQAAAASREQTARKYIQRQLHPGYQQYMDQRMNTIEVEEEQPAQQLPKTGRHEEDEQPDPNSPHEIQQREIEKFLREQNLIPASSGASSSSALGPSAGQNVLPKGFCGDAGHGLDQVGGPHILKGGVMQRAISTAPRRKIALGFPPPTAYVCAEVANPNLDAGSYIEDDWAHPGLFLDEVPARYPFPTCVPRCEYTGCKLCRSPLQIETPQDAQGLICRSVFSHKQGICGEDAAKKLKIQNPKPLAKIYFCSCSCGFRYIGETNTKHNRWRTHDFCSSSVKATEGQEEGPLYSHLKWEKQGHTTSWRLLFVLDPAVGEQIFFEHNLIKWIESLFILHFKTYAPFGANRQFLCPLTLKQRNATKMEESLLASLRWLTEPVLLKGSFVEVIRVRNRKKKANARAKTSSTSMPFSPSLSHAPRPDLATGKPSSDLLTRNFSPDLKGPDPLGSSSSHLPLGSSLGTAGHQEAAADFELLATQSQTQMAPEHSQSGKELKPWKKKLTTELSDRVLFQLEKIAGHMSHFPAVTKWSAAEYVDMFEALDTVEVVDSRLAGLPLQWGNFTLRCWTAMERIARLYTKKSLAKDIVTRLAATTVIAQGTKNFLIQMFLERSDNGLSLIRYLKDAERQKSNRDGREVLIIRFHTQFMELLGLQRFLRTDVDIGRKYMPCWQLNATHRITNYVGLNHLPCRHPMTYKCRCKFYQNFLPADCFALGHLSLQCSAQTVAIFAKPEYRAKLLSCPAFFRSKFRFSEEWSKKTLAHRFKPHQREALRVALPAHYTETLSPLLESPEAMELAKSNDVRDLPEFQYVTKMLAENFYVVQFDKLNNLCLECISYHRMQQEDALGLVQYNELREYNKIQKQRIKGKEKADAAAKTKAVNATGLREVGAGSREVDVGPTAATKTDDEDDGVASIFDGDTDPEYRFIYHKVQPLTVQDLEWDADQTREEQLLRQAHQLAKENKDVMAPLEDENLLVDDDDGNLRAHLSKNEKQQLQQGSQNSQMINPTPSQSQTQGIQVSSQNIRLGPTSFGGHLASSSRPLGLNGASSPSLFSLGSQGTQGSQTPFSPCPLPTPTWLRTTTFGERMRNADRSTAEARRMNALSARETLSAWAEKIRERERQGTVTGRDLDREREAKEKWEREQKQALENAKARAAFTASTRAKGVQVINMKQLRIRAAKAKARKVEARKFKKRHKLTKQQFSRARRNVLAKVARRPVSQPIFVGPWGVPISVVEFTKWGAAHICHAEYLKKRMLSGPAFLESLGLPKVRLLPSRGRLTVPAKDPRPAIGATSSRGTSATPSLPLGGVGVSSSSSSSAHTKEELQPPYMINMTNKVTQKDKDASSFVFVKSSVAPTRLPENDILQCPFFSQKSVFANGVLQVLDDDRLAYQYYCWWWNSKFDTAEKDKLVYTNLDSLLDLEKVEDMTRLMLGRKKFDGTSEPCAYWDLEESDLDSCSEWSDLECFDDEDQEEDEVDDPLPPLPQSLPPSSPFVLAPSDTRAGKRQPIEAQKLLKDPRLTGLGGLDSSRVNGGPSEGSNLGGLDKNPEPQLKHRKVNAAIISSSKGAGAAVVSDAGAKGAVPIGAITAIDSSSTAAAVPSSTTGASAAASSSTAAAVQSSTTGASAATSSSTTAAASAPTFGDVAATAPSTILREPQGEGLVEEPAEHNVEWKGIHIRPIQPAVPVADPNKNTKAGQTRKASETKKRKREENLDGEEKPKDEERGPAAGEEYFFENESRQSRPGTEFFLPKLLSTPGVPYKKKQEIMQRESEKLLAALAETTQQEFVSASRPLSDFYDADSKSLLSPPKTRSLDAGLQIPCGIEDVPFESSFDLWDDVWPNTPEEQSKASIFKVCLDINKESLLREIKSLFPKWIAEWMGDFFASFYMPVKRHKLPVLAHRGVTSSTIQTVLGFPAKIVDVALKEVYDALERTLWFGKCWRVGNATDALKRIRQGRFSKFIGADFAAMYDNVTHSQLIQVLCKCIDLIHGEQKGRVLVLTRRFVKGQFKRVGRFVTKSDIGKEDRIISCEDLKKLVQLVVENNYVFVHDLIFYQRQGVPQGLSCSPVMTCLFLAYFEVAYQDKNRITDSTEVRYLDDLCMKKYVNPKKIYPDSFDVILTTPKEGTLSHDFLDLSLALIAGRLFHRVYDKRRSFKFKLQKFMHKSSCIPSSNHGDHFKSASIRLYCLNFFVTFFIFDLVEMLGYFVENETYKVDFVYKALATIVQRHKIKKWGLDSKAFIEKIALLVNKVYLLMLRPPRVLLQDEE